MAIEVTCPACGKSFSAWEELVGKTAQCPRCEAKVTVPDPNLEGVTLADEDEAEGKAEAQAEAEDEAEIQAEEDDEDEYRLSPVEQPPAPAEASVCPRCHAAMPQETLLCTHCGYHRMVDRPIEAVEPQEAMQEEPQEELPQELGFRRWLSSQLEEGESLESVSRLAWVLCPLLALFMIGLLLAVCGPWILLLVLPLLVLAVLWALGIARPQWLEADNLVLVLQRAVAWRALAWPYPRLQTRDFRHTTLTDDELDHLADEGDLDGCHALDLEGTALTDASLPRLKKLQQLRFLVLRQTQVGQQAVRRLQKARPELWIWYDSDRINQADPPEQPESTGPAKK